MSQLQALTEREAFALAKQEKFKEFTITQNLNTKRYFVVEGLTEAWEWETLIYKGKQPTEVPPTDEVVGKKPTKPKLITDADNAPYKEKKRYAKKVKPDTKGERPVKRTERQQLTEAQKRLPELIRKNLTAEMASKTYVYPKGHPNALTKEQRQAAIEKAKQVERTPKRYV